MKKSMASLIVFAALMYAFPAGAIEKLYFADVGNDKILRCNLDGSSLEELVTSGIEVVGDIAIDRGAGRMYWTDWASGTSYIRRAGLDGSNIEILVTGLSGPWGIALDVSGGKMYWTEFSSQIIRRANLDGTGIEDLVTTGLSHPTGIALDLAGGKMYWGDGATEYTGKIQRANLDGTNVETLVNDPLIAPADLALDPAGDWMYWADLGTDSWYRAHLDGTGLVEILLSSYGTPIGVALDLAAAKLYVSEYGGPNSEIKRTNLDGTAVEVILSSGVGAIYGLTLGPAAAECSASWMTGPWLGIVTGVEPYDYAVYMIFDGQGIISEMGAFNVPDPAGTYTVAEDCGMTGTLWSDGYVPFTGYLYSETLAEIDMGFGPMQLLKVTDPGALATCWAGYFVFEPTGEGWIVTLELDENGSIVSSTGFPTPVTGKIFTEPGQTSDYLAGHLALGPGGPWDELMFQEAFASGDSLLWGDFDLDCGTSCPGGTFELRLCSASSVEDDLPAGSSVRLSNYPNPFNPRTTIFFHLSEPTAVSLRIFDVSGRLVRMLLNETVVSSGRQEVVWNGQDDTGRRVASGTYFYRLEVGEYSETRRMALIK